MDSNQKFLEYARAFEEAYRSGDWPILEPFFTEDAVYEVLAEPPFGACHEGREAILQSFKKSVDNFDRRFDSRQVELVQGPEEKDGATWISWRATYRAEGVPDLVLLGEERAWFAGGYIQRLEDRFATGIAAQTITYLRTYEENLKPAPGIE